MATLAKWRCHKIVRAGKILEFDIGQGKLLVEGLHGPVEQRVDPSFSARSAPAVGDFFVLYDDGYASHSPAKAFEDGYGRLEE